MKQFKTELFVYFLCLELLSLHRLSHAMAVLQENLEWHLVEIGDIRLTGAGLLDAYEKDDVRHVLVTTYDRKNPKNDSVFVLNSTILEHFTPNLVKWGLSYPRNVFKVPDKTFKFPAITIPDGDVATNSPGSIIVADVRDFAKPIFHRITDTSQPARMTEYTNPVWPNSKEFLVCQANHVNEQTKWNLVHFQKPFASETRPWKETPVKSDICDSKMVLHADIWRSFDALYAINRFKRSLNLMWTERKNNRHGSWNKPAEIKTESIDTGEFKDLMLADLNLDGSQDLLVSTTSEVRAYEIPKEKFRDPKEYKVHILMDFTSSVDGSMCPNVLKTFIPFTGYKGKPWVLVAGGTCGGAAYLVPTSHTTSDDWGYQRYTILKGFTVLGVEAMDIDRDGFTELFISLNDIGIIKVFSLRRGKPSEATTESTTTATTTTATTASTATTTLLIETTRVVTSADGSSVVDDIASTTTGPSKTETATDPTEANLPDGSTTPQITTSDELTTSNNPSSTDTGMSSDSGWSSSLETGFIDVASQASTSGTPTSSVDSDHSTKHSSSISDRTTDFTFDSVSTSRDSPSTRSASGSETSATSFRTTANDRTSTQSGEFESTSTDPKVGSTTGSSPTAVDDIMTDTFTNGGESAVFSFQSTSIEITTIGDRQSSGSTTVIEIEATTGLESTGWTTDGLTTDGLTTDGLTTDGLTTDGLTTDGLTTDGLTTDGLTTDGLTTDGLTTDGLTTDGLTTDGLTTDGLTAVVSLQTDFNISTSKHFSTAPDITNNFTGETISTGQRSAAKASVTPSSTSAGLEVTSTESAATTPSAQAASSSYTSDFVTTTDLDYVTAIPDVDGDNSTTSKQISATESFTATDSNDSSNTTTPTTITTTSDGFTHEDYASFSPASSSPVDDSTKSTTTTEHNSNPSSSISDGVESTSSESVVKATTASVATEVSSSTSEHSVTTDASVTESSRLPENSSTYFFTEDLHTNDVGSSESVVDGDYTSYGRTNSSDQLSTVSFDDPSDNSSSSSSPVWFSTKVSTRIHSTTRSTTTESSAALKSYEGRRVFVFSLMFSFLALGRYI